MKGKQIKKTEPIRCVIDTVNDASEISLNENITRKDLSPADQFARFRELPAGNRAMGILDRLLTLELVIQLLKRGRYSIPSGRIDVSVASSVGIG